MHLLLSHLPTPQILHPQRPHPLLIPPLRPFHLPPKPHEPIKPLLPCHLLDVLQILLRGRIELRPEPLRPPRELIDNARDVASTTGVARREPDAPDVLVALPHDVLDVREALGGEVQEVDAGYAGAQDAYAEFAPGAVEVVADADVRAAGGIGEGGVQVFGDEVRGGRVGEGRFGVVWDAGHLLIGCAGLGSESPIDGKRGSVGLIVRSVLQLWPGTMLLGCFVRDEPARRSLDAVRNVSTFPTLSLVLSLGRGSV